MATQERLQGIYTPNLVPLDERGEVNEPVLRQYIDWLIAKGVQMPCRRSWVAISLDSVRTLLLVG